MMRPIFTIDPHSRPRSDCPARPILLFLTRRTYDAEVALDLTAETFARAYASRRRFRGRTDDDLAAWLFGIARNVLARYIRRGVVERRCLERLGIDVPTMTPDEITRVNELAGLSHLRRAVAEEFAALANDQRTALQLRVINELDYPEVARRLNVPEATARARVWSHAVSRHSRARSTIVNSRRRHPHDHSPRHECSRRPAGAYRPRCPLRRRDRAPRAADLAKATSAPDRRRRSRHPGGGSNRRECDARLYPLRAIGFNTFKPTLGLEPRTPLLRENDE